MYLGNETSYWEAKNILAVYFDVIFDWDQDSHGQFFHGTPP